MREQTQYSGGSVTSFIIVGIILVGVLGLAAYALVERSEQVRREEAIAVLEEDQVDPPAGVDGENSTGQSEADESEASDERSSERTDEPEATPSSDSDIPAAGGVGDAGAGGANTGGQSTAELPATGVADTSAIIVALAGLSLGAVYYLRSRSERLRAFDLQ